MAVNLIGQKSDQELSGAKAECGGGGPTTTYVPMGPPHFNGGP